jgi:UDP-N-acetyl-D-glucosamine dehydrogenase
VELAQEINTRMPAYVAERAAGLLNSAAKPVNGARVLILGVTYKPDVADERESPAKPVARKLRARSAMLSYHDPYVDSWLIDSTSVPRVTDCQLYAAVADADLVILLQDHAAYDLDKIAREARLLLDTRGRITGPRVQAL